MKTAGVGCEADALLLLRRGLTQTAGTGREVGDICAVGRRGHLWLA